MKPPSTRNLVDYSRITSYNVCYTKLLRQIAFAKARRFYLVDDLILHPLWRPVTAVAVKMGLGCRGDLAQPSGMQPPDVAVDEQLEAVAIAFLLMGQRQLGVPQDQFTVLAGAA